MQRITAKKTMVKICGLRRPEDAQAANELNPDLAGFILSPGYRRSIDTEQAKKLREILSPKIRTVGVFVDAPSDEILRAAKSGCIDMIQLHGREDDAYITRLTGLTDLPVIKAFRISEKKDLEAAAASAAHWILLDSGAGTGKPFDWDLLERFLQEGKNRGESERVTENPEKKDCAEMTESAEMTKCALGTCSAEIKLSNIFPGGHPWLLAGGLTAENVGAAIRRFHPTVVDVSSKVETDGFKDPAKMAAFIAAVRADQHPRIIYS